MLKIVRVGLAMLAVATPATASEYLNGTYKGTVGLRTMSIKFNPDGTYYALQQAEYAFGKQLWGAGYDTGKYRLEGNIAHIDNMKCLFTGGDEFVKFEGCGLTAVLMRVADLQIQQKPNAPAAQPTLAPTEAQPVAPAFPATEPSQPTPVVAAPPLPKAQLASPPGTSPAAPSLSTNWETNASGAATLDIPHESDDPMKAGFVRLECDKDAEGKTGLVVFFQGASRYDGKWTGADVLTDKGQSNSVPTFCGSDEGGSACWLKLSKDAVSAVSSSASFSVQMAGAKLFAATLSDVVIKTISACSGSPADAHLNIQNVYGWHIGDTDNGKVATFEDVSFDVDLRISCAGPKALRYQFDGHEKRVRSVTIPNANGDVVLRPDPKGFLSSKDAARFVKEIGNLIDEAKSYGNYNPLVFSVPLFVNSMYGSSNVLIGDITKVREEVRSSCVEMSGLGSSEPAEANCADGIHQYIKESEDEILSHGEFCDYAAQWATTLDKAASMMASCPAYETKYPGESFVTADGGTPIRQMMADKSCGN